MRILAALCTLLAAMHVAAAPFAYVPNQASNNVSVIDVATNAVVATVPVGGSPSSAAVHAGIGRAYVAHSAGVDVIDTATNMVVASFCCGGPLAVNAAGTRLFAGTWVFDTAGNNLLYGLTDQSPPQNTPAGLVSSYLAVTPDGGRVYIAHSYYYVSVIDVANNAQIATINVDSSYGIAINAAGTRAYVAAFVNPGVGVLLVIDIATNTVIASVPLGAHAPTGVAVNPAGTRVFLTDGTSNVLVVDATTNTYVGSVAVGSNPIGVNFEPSGSRAYVVNHGSNTVSVIDVATLAVTATIPVGAAPQGLGLFIDPQLPIPPAIPKTTPSITLSSSPNPSVEGQRVGITADVHGASGTPTGRIVFQIDGVASSGCAGLWMTNGSAYCYQLIWGGTPGTHLITAVYSGDTAYNGVTSSALSQVVVGKPTPSITLASTANPSTLGQYVIFTAAVSGGSGTPTGTIVLRNNGNIVDGCGGLVMTNGRASCTMGNLPLGTNSMTAAYSGDSIYAALTSSTLPQVVNAAKANTPRITLGSSVNPSTVGQVVEFTGVVSGSAGTPTGRLVFLDDSNVISGCAGLPMTNGQATCSPGNLTLGTHTMTAVYSGDATYNGLNSSNLPQAVNPAKPNTPSFTLGSSVNPSNAGQMVTFTAVLSGSAGTVTGNVVFRDNGRMISGCGGIALTNGRVTCTPGFNTTGTHSITGIYLGDGNYNGITSSVLPQAVQ